MPTLTTPIRFDWPGFAAALDTIRESRGLQWKDVSEQSGISASTLSRLSKGKGCDVDAIAALRGWMNVPIDRFFTGGAK